MSASNSLLLNLLQNLLVEDRLGNKHVISNGKLFASYFKCQPVSVKVYPDETGALTFLSLTSDVVVFYSVPIEISDSPENWLDNLESCFFTAYAFGAVNGLIFHTNVSWVRGELKPIFQSARTSELQIAMEGHEMAMSLLLHMTGQEWDKNFMQKEVAAQMADFKNLLNAM